MVAEMLHELGYSLQANAKTIEGASHPDRNAQFEHINQRVGKFLSQRQPVISVDTQKKELVGGFKNNGRELRPKGRPEKVRVHDFVIPELGRAIPYGVYDLGTNTGWVGAWVWTTTPRSLRWKPFDAGGSKGSRLRLWKTEIQKLADEMKIPISICHFPPGTSKWNKILGAF
jgi:Rhodopirellula transposase DDE domain